jgi:hypothetical protein
VERMEGNMVSYDFVVKKKSLPLASILAHSSHIVLVDPDCQKGIHLSSVKGSTSP